MKFVNLTPHDITVEGVGVFPASGNIARVETKRVCIGGWGKVRITKQTFGDVSGVPAPQDGVAYIVSGMVLSALNGSRADVVAPDTGADAVRSNGHIVAVRGFVN
jgi:hypothetical protein